MKMAHAEEKRLTLHSTKEVSVPSFLPYLPLVSSQTNSAYLTQQT